MNSSPPISKIKDFNKCYLCEQNNFQLLYSKGRNNERVLNYICNECGFIFILPRPPKKRLLDLYKDGKFRNSSPPSEKKCQNNNKVAKIREKIISKFDFPKGKLLEIGCSTGHFLHRMKKHKWQVTGLESDTMYSNFAKTQLDIEMVNCFLEDFKCNDKFDLVCNFHVIEHVRDVNGFLSDIRNLMKDGGILFLEYPSFNNIYTRDINKFFWSAHINTFSDNTMKLFLAKNGFKILKQIPTNGFFCIIATKTMLEENLVFQPPNLKNISNIINKYS